MQFVKSEELKPGMRLAKPIYNKMGVLLYERDTKLTLQSINSIVNFGLIGIFILEPAEPVPPLSREDMEFEQFQTIYMFKLKDCMDKLTQDRDVPDITELVQNIYTHYGALDHKLNFTQNLRSSADFVYKHAISVAMLSAMVANELRIGFDDSQSLIAAALLYDYGYLSVAKTILDKGEELTISDRDLIQLKLEQGYEAMRPHFEELGLENTSLEVIRNVIFKKNPIINPKPPRPQVQLLIDILKTADQFDRMTAMNINHPPVSELAAMTYFYAHPDEYDKHVVAALADSIHILPAGACLDFSNGEKGLVLVENPADFLHPMVLLFKDNRLCDLSDPDTGKVLEIVDIMKTMDNRIAIDSDTLKQFVADPYIKETTDRFRAQKERIAKRQQERLLEAAKRKIAAATAQNAADAAFRSADTISGTSGATPDEEEDDPEDDFSLGMADTALGAEDADEDFADAGEAAEQTPEPEPPKRTGRRKRLV